jgi:hypothetical protein
MLAPASVQAIVGQHQALDRLTADDVGVDDFIDVGLRNVSIPNGIGIDNEVWAMFALIETARLVGPYFAFEAAFREFLFEEFLQFRLAAGIAASPWISRRTLVAAYEDVFFELGHEITKQDSTA